MIHIDERGVPEELIQLRKAMADLSTYSADYLSPFRVTKFHSTLSFKKDLAIQLLNNPIVIKITTKQDLFELSDLLGKGNFRTIIGTRDIWVITSKPEVKAVIDLCIPEEKIYYYRDFTEKVNDILTEHPILKQFIKE